MNAREITKWWEKGIIKERNRFHNVPKPLKNDKFGVPREFSSFAPPLAKFGKDNASKRRSS